MKNRVSTKVVSICPSILLLLMVLVLPNALKAGNPESTKYFNELRLGSSFINELNVSDLDRSAQDVLKSEINENTVIIRNWHDLTDKSRIYSAGYDSNDNFLGFVELSLSLDAGALSSVAPPPHCGPCGELPNRDKADAYKGTTFIYCFMACPPRD